MDVNRYGSLQQFLRVTAYVKRFVRNVRSEKIGEEVALKTLTADNIEEAWRFWIISEQVVLMKNENVYLMYIVRMKICWELNHVLQKLLN